MSRVLIIEDSEELRRLLCRGLAPAGHEVVAAASGAEGIRLFREKPADVVITDIFMPEMDGLEIIRALRKESQGFRVVAISGGGSMGNVDILRAAKQMGADRILAKPFRIQDLLKIIEELSSAPPPAAAGPAASAPGA